MHSTSFVLLAAVVCLAVPGEALAQGEADLERGIEAFNKRDYAKAGRWLHKASVAATLAP